MKGETVNIEYKLERANAFWMLCLILQINLLLRTMLLMSL